MSRSAVTHSIVAAMAVAALALPARLSAQQLDTVVVTASSRADELYRRAETLRAQPNRWRQAADLYMRSAAARRAEDPLAVRCLTLAGHFYFAADDVASARGAMLRAADRAHERGDVITAAHRYLDAGWLAARVGDRANMEYFNNKAQMLASSPLLSAAQRSGILDRVGVDGRAVAMLPAPEN
jgi:hypothetical protein